MFTLLVFVSASYAANSTVENDPTGEVIETGEPVDEVTDFNTDFDNSGTDPDSEYLDEGAEPEDNEIDLGDYLDDELDYLDDGMWYLDDESGYVDEELGDIVDDMYLDDTLYTDEEIDEDSTDSVDYIDYDNIEFPNEFEDILPDLDTEFKDGIDTSDDGDTITDEDLIDFEYYLNTGDITSELKVYNVMNMNSDLNRENNVLSGSNPNTVELIYSTSILGTNQNKNVIRNIENKDNSVNTGLKTVNEPNTISQSNTISQTETDNAKNSTNIQTVNAGVTPKNIGILDLIFEILAAFWPKF